MAGRQSFSKLRDKISPERRAASSSKAKRILAQMELKELRKHSGKTQKEIAALLGISQSSLSQTEARTDMQIETLRKIINSLGGELDLIAHFPDGDVRLTQFSNAE